MAAVRAVCVMRGEGAVQGVIHFEQQVRARPCRRDPPGGCGAPRIPPLSLLPASGGPGSARAAAVPNGRGPRELRRPSGSAEEPRPRGPCCCCCPVKVRDLSGMCQQITGSGALSDKTGQGMCWRGLNEHRRSGQSRPGLVAGPPVLSVTFV